MTEYSDNLEENLKIMKKHKLMLLKGIRESRFEEEFYDLVNEFRYRIHSDYKAETVLLSEGHRQIRVKEKKLLGLLSKTFVMNFYATIFWRNEEETEYDVLYSFDYGTKDKDWSFMGSNGYLKGDDVIGVFKKQCLKYQIFMYED